MNITSLNETSTTSEFAIALDLAREAIINYGGRAISIVDVFVDLFGLLLLRNKRLEEKFYDFLFFHCFHNLVVCLLGTLV